MNLFLLIAILMAVFGIVFIVIKEQKDEEISGAYYKGFVFGLILSPFLFAGVVGVTGTSAQDEATEVEQVCECNCREVGK